jgi:hypothetical protein
MHGDRSGAGTEVDGCATPPAATQALRRPDGQVLRLPAGHEHSRLKSDGVAAEAHETENPLERLTALAPSNHLIEFGCVRRTRSEILGLVLRGDATGCRKALDEDFEPQVALPSNAPAV